MSLRQWLFGAALAVLGMSFSVAAASADVASAAARVAYTPRATEQGGTEAARRVRA